MSELFITPIKLVNQIENLNATPKVENIGGGSVFKDVFQNAINDVVSTEKELTNQQYLLATGQTEDAHAVPIAASEAQLSVDLLVQLRNKALEAYNELSRISV